MFFSLAQTNYYLNFWVAKYYYNGTLLMFDRLENDFLQCSNSNDEKTNYKIFGNNIKSECKIDITKYLNSYSSYFYEIDEAYKEKTIKLFEQAKQYKSENN